LQLESQVANMTEEIRTLRRQLQHSSVTCEDTSKREEQRDQLQQIVADQNTERGKLVRELDAEKMQSKAKIQGLESANQDLIQKLAAAKLASQSPGENKQGVGKEESQLAQQPAPKCLVCANMKTTVAAQSKELADLQRTNQEMEGQAVAQNKQLADLQKRNQEMERQLQITAKSCEEAEKLGQQCKQLQQTVMDLKTQQAIIGVCDQCGIWRQKHTALEEKCVKLEQKASQNSQELAGLQRQLRHSAVTCEESENWEQQCKALQQTVLRMKMKEATHVCEQCDIWKQKHDALEEKCTALQDQVLNHNLKPGQLYDKIQSLEKANQSLEQELKVFKMQQEKDAESAAEKKNKLALAKEKLLAARAKKTGWRGGLISCRNLV